MSTRILQVPVGAPQTYRPNGFPHSFCAQPGAAGTIGLDYSLDNGQSWITQGIIGGGQVHAFSMSTAALGVGAGLFQQGQVQGAIPPGAIIRASAGVVTGQLLCSELGAPGGTLYERQTLVQAAVAYASQVAVTTEQTMFSARFPAGFLPLNFALDVETWWTIANTATIKTIKHYFGPSANVIDAEGGTSLVAAGDVVTSMAGLRLLRSVAGRNDGQTVIATNAGLASGGGFGNSVTANVSVTSSNYGGGAPVEQVLRITSTNATGADTCTLDRVTVRLMQ